MKSEEFKKIAEWVGYPLIAESNGLVHVSWGANEITELYNPETNVEQREEILLRLPPMEALDMFKSISLWRKTPIPL